MVEREWDDPNWSIGDTLTAQQFADHVTEGHFPSDELQFTITTDGNPAFVDPQNGDAEILTYDRSAQTWTLNTLNATTEVTSPSVTTDALEASGSLSGPTASEGDVVTVPDNPDVVPIYFDAQNGESLYPDLEETV